MLTGTQTTHHARPTFKLGHIQHSPLLPLNSSLLHHDTPGHLYITVLHAERDCMQSGRFPSSSDPIFKAATSGFNGQIGLHQHLPARKGTLKPSMLPRVRCSSVQPLNQKELLLHSGLSVRIIKDPNGRAGSVQTQAQAGKIKVMEMWPSSEEDIHMEFSAVWTRPKPMWTKGGGGISVSLNACV